MEYYQGHEWQVNIYYLFNSADKILTKEYNMLANSRKEVWRLKSYKTILKYRNPRIWEAIEAF